MAGMSSAVPESVTTLEDDAKVFGEVDAKRVFKNTGVRQRHVTKNGMTAALQRLSRAKTNPKSRCDARARPPAHPSAPATSTHVPPISSTA